MNDYQAKFVAPEQAVKAVQSGDWVDYGFGAGFPELLDKALAARKGEVKDVKVRGGLVIRPRIEVVEADPEQESFSYYSWHVGDYERKLQKNGLVKFMPVMLRSLPYLYRDKHIRCDVAFVPVSKPDENGYCGLGISNYAWRTIFESARTVIFEINEHYPKLQGVDGLHRVHLSEADYIVEGEHEPLPVRSYRAPSETDIAIAKIVVNEIPDGAVLSLGVGGVPYTVAKMLAESDKKDLGCHTGTISDAFLELYRAGKLTNAHKELDTGLSAWNLAMGSQELYDWLDAEPQLFHPGDLDYIHSVERISKFSNVISINGGVQLDLMGQENAESTGTRQLSGVGGQMDFLEGAYRSKGGKAETKLRERAKKDELFANGTVHLSTSQIHTVKPLEVDIPKGRFTVVTGVSGSGKTTMVLESLVPALEAKINGNPLPAHIRSVEADGIAHVKLIDATPIGINVRSTVATYAGVHDELRKLYAKSPDAKEHGYKASDFSYNTGSLRCPGCDGTGVVSLDVQFLPDVNIPCPDCRGSRYARAAYGVKLMNKAGENVSLPELMDMDVNSAIEFCADRKTVSQKLGILKQLGLGYLTLGEETPSLSGGEAQRLKLASEIGRTQTDSVFVFDEPSIGLHPLDVRVLLGVFQALLDNGATVVVIEHDLDVIRNADFLIDMGPGGGEAGGRIVASGTPEEIQLNPDSITGQYL